jgi:phosphoheptose isomerase
MKLAKKRGLKVIAILGFDGGKAKKIADFAIHCKTSTYEHHEDLAQIIMHYIFLQLR